ncbi:MAG: hypothetical protein WA956_05765 [Stenotrophomonas sp.]
MARSLTRTAQAMKVPKADTAQASIARALEWIDTARDDISRGDLLDAADSLLVARRYLGEARESRFAALTSKER